MDRKEIERKVIVMYPELTKKQIQLVATQVKKELKTNGKLGAGLFSNIVSGVKSLAKKAAPVLASAAVSAVQNKVIDKVGPSKEGCKERNPDWEYTPKSGELHQVYVTKEGCRYTSKFSGPGTHLVDDVKQLLNKAGGNISQAVQSSNFTSDIDREALAHDLRYLLSKGDPKLVREADRIFINKLKTINDANAAVPLAAMIAKTKGEDAGIVKVYSGDEKATDEELDLMKKVLDHMEMLGFGKVRPKRGGKRSEARDAEEGVRGGAKKEVKKTKWAEHVASEWSKVKGKGVSYKDCLINCKKTYKK